MSDYAVYLGNAHKVKKIATGSYTEMKILFDKLSRQLWNENAKFYCLQLLINK